MKKRSSKLFGVVFVAVLLLCMIPTISPAARCQLPAPAFWVEPATENFTTADATVGTLFNVTVCGAAADNTMGWCVQLGFDPLELQAAAVDYSEFFAGHAYEQIAPSIDNDAGTVRACEYLPGTDYIGPTSGSLFSVTFEIIVAPAQGQSLTSLIDPSYGVASYNTLFANTSGVQETPLSTAPCAYTYRDSAAWSPNPTFVSCSPNPVHANSPVTCTAVVSSLNATGSVVWSSNSSTGSFSPSVCTLSSGICSTTYTDTSPGTVTITASYSGDPNNTPSNGSTILEVEQAEQSSTYVYCSPNPVHYDGPVTCTVTVSGDNPTGTVTWSSNSSTGSFSPSVCTVSYGYCWTTYTDSSPGTVMITASYSGDSFNAPSDGSTVLEVNSEPEQSWTYVYCSSSSVYANSPVTCTAWVNGFNPTGTVTWSSNSSTGSFSSSACVLSSGTCSTTYTDTSPGTVTITASYNGDPDNAPSSSSTSLTVIAEPVLPPEVLLNVPYHHQRNGYYCGPAALEEVFDFYGPDVSQFQIADVARTTPDGTYGFDLLRAAQFSNLSNSAESRGSDNFTGFAGYATRSLGYAALEYGGMTVEELKAVLAAGYPVIVLTTWHFRVAVGYDDKYIIFQDPYYGSMYKMTYDAFSSDWDYSGHWALLVTPWQVEVSSPHNVMPGDTFNVNATITYPEVYPFQYAMPPEATSVNVTITLPSGLVLAPTETAQKACESYFEPGQSFNVSWQVECQSVGGYRIGVEAEGLVSFGMPPEPPAYPQPYVYQDRIGGTNESTVAATSTPDTTPPVTTEDYDGSWQNHAFAINLTASDDMSGVLDTYYKVNGGPEETLSVDGEPIIATPGANNTLEYWSVDWAGNEELPHKFLTNIKLDKTPPSIDNPVFTPATNIQPHQDVEVTVNATDALSGIQNVTLLYSTNDGATWTHQAMTLNASTLLYEANIPGQLAGTLVRFDVTACDQARNTVTVTNWFSDFTYEVPPLSANMTCNVETLNLGFKGQWLAFCLKPPEGYSVDSINVTSLALNDSVLANPQLTNVTSDKNGVTELLVGFNRTSVSKLIISLGVTTGNVTLGFNGRLNDGSLFEGVCTLEVRMPGDVNMDGKVDIKDISAVAKAFGTSLGQPGYKLVLNENEDGRIDIRDIALIAKNFGKTYN